jgi:uncharacterized protein
MNRVISQSEVKGFVFEILRSMQSDAWIPDYIVGINRGGLVPANMISQYLDIRLVTLDVSFSTNNFESNLWIPEDILDGKKVLFVDDINDTGNTINWIVNDMTSSITKKKELRKEFEIDGNARFAVLLDNIASESTVEVAYYGEDINKVEQPVWIVFPWENWWRTE